MSTLRLTTISNQTGSASVPSDTVINGSAKAWVNFNGTGTVAIRASFNVSSITDNGTGDYTVNFTTALADANYSVCSVCCLSDSIVAGNTDRGFSPRSYTTSSVRLLVTDGGSGNSC
jgi:hypothetical protein